MQGVPAYGIVDSGSDVTIIGGELFKRVASIAKLQKRDFKQCDKVPHNYDQHPFHLDGNMNLDISFNDKTMQTPIYIKMDAPEQLLLSEGVCSQLGIVTYHHDVEVWRGGRKSKKRAQSGEVQVPTVRVRLVHLPPHQSILAKV